MSIEAILAGIYGNDGSAALAFDLSGKLLWKNSSADELLKKEDVSPAEIFALLCAEKNSCGNMEFFNGGNLRRADICGSELYIAEIYSVEKLAELFAAPFFKRYIEYADSQVRQAVTSISAACELIGDLVKSDTDVDISECLEGIMNGCCRLMRGTAVGMQLSAASDGNNINVDIINLKEYMVSLSDGCAAVLGDMQCRICGDVPDCYVSANKELLTAFILMLIRKIMPNKGMRLSFDADSDGEYAELRAFSEDSGGERISSRESTFEEAYEIISRKLGAEFTVCSDSFSVKLKCTEYTGDAVFDSKKYFFTGNFFSPCRIMLGDLADFRSFY